ncbi:transcriptional regulator, AraC family [Candidatus Vecturithrix granuli]|uniref:Transcriptional regulator, AraC family n=1 Tax=Vecturithrix granuli TaxID=1499967 RepID=A0A081C0T9_VECG1|nr:transcriptional regulator, AraC family [Candidatus Vecturithrix granuli]
MLQQLQITKYPVTHPLLKTLIKYFWVMRSEQEVMIRHKLLPVGNIDIVLNCSAPMTYRPAQRREIHAQGFHLTGIRQRYALIEQRGILDLLGIAFFPMGIYPFLKIPLSELTNRTVDLDVLLKNFTARVQDRLTYAHAIAEKLHVLEVELLHILDPALLPPKEHIQAFHTFSAQIEIVSVQQFCDAYGVHPRTFERLFQKQIGVSPKFFQRLSRFQRALNQMMRTNVPRFTTIAHEHDYYDQAHCIKDFIAFSGCSPSQFLHEALSVKQIMTIL